jgi:hypothetical protein
VKNPKPCSDISCTEKERVPYWSVVIYVITGDLREGSTLKNFLIEVFREIGMSATIIDPETVNPSIVQTCVCPFISKVAEKDRQSLK